MDERDVSIVVYAPRGPRIHMQMRHGPTGLAVSGLDLNRARVYALLWARLLELLAAYWHAGYGPWLLAQSADVE